MNQFALKSKGSSSARVSQHKGDWRCVAAALESVGGSGGRVASATAEEHNTSTKVHRYGEAAHKNVVGAPYRSYGKYAIGDET